MAWRVAKSLDTLRTQINAAHPGRSKIADGTIGDAAHAREVSDHNPDRSGIVRALDVTNDNIGGPKDSLDASDLAEALLRSQDPRIKYLISDRRIASSYPVGGVPPWRWRPYAGADPHTGHVHISVVADARADSTKAWKITVTKPAHVTMPVLREGSKGAAVKTLQRCLGIAQDGVFGQQTRYAVRRFQRAAKLTTDGVVGPATWKALGL